MTMTEEVTAYLTSKCVRHIRKRGLLGEDRDTAAFIYFMGAGRAALSDGEFVIATHLTDIAAQIAQRGYVVVVELAGEGAADA